jgi:hypothetical protein
MSSNGESVELRRLRESARRARVFYEIFPVLTYQPLDSPFDWFEVALHAEADIQKPLDCPESLDAIAVLKELAEFLAGRTPEDGHCERHLSTWYYTAQPPAAGEALSATRLFRSLSLVVLNVPPYRTGEQPPLLAELRTQLQELNISQIKVARS